MITFWKQMKEEGYATFMSEPSQVLCDKQNSFLLAFLEGIEEE